MVSSLSVLSLRKDLTMIVDSFQAARKPIKSAQCHTKVKVSVFQCFSSSFVSKISNVVEIAKLSVIASIRDKFIDLLADSV